MRTLPAFLLLLVLPWLGAGEAGDRIQARIDAAARDAARAAASLTPMAAPPVASAPPVGTIAISSVTRVGTGDVPRYGRLELLVAFSAMTGTKYYDVRTDVTKDGIDLQATFTAPDGGIWRIPGYYDGTNWRIRFAPDAIGTWNYTVRAVDRSGSYTWTGGTFTCAGSSSHGWVRVDGRWLRHADGTAFCPVPHNTGWLPDVELPVLSALAADAPAGSAPRLLSFWLSQPWSGTASRHVIERIDASVWSYDQTSCAYIDGVVTRAEAAGVYLMPSIWAHDQLRTPGIPWSGGNWAAQPYSTLSAAVDFFKTTAAGSDTEQWIRQKNFYRYVIARWGDSPAIAGWVGAVELNGTTGYDQNQSQAEEWTAMVDDWFVANDQYRSRNGSVPISFSLSAEGSGTPLLDPLGVLSQRAIDSYDAKFDDVGIASQLATECLALGGTKPVLITEFGGYALNATAPDIPATQPLHLHNGVWSSLVAGAAMPAMLWCDDTGSPSSHYPLLDAPMRQHLAHLAKFIGPNTWLADDTQVIAVAATGARSADVRGWSRRIADRGMAWLQRYTGAVALDSAATAVTCANGDYAVWWFDAWTGTETTSDQAVTTGSLTLTVPDIDNARPDIAVSWQRYPTAPTNVTISVPAGERALFTFASSAPLSRVMTLPANGRLWQTADGVTTGAEITTVPTVITDPSRRVIYQASAVLGLETFTFAATDARLSRTATASITVTNPPPGSSIIPIENVPGSGGCGAGGFAGLGLLSILVLLPLRRMRRSER